MWSRKSDSSTRYTGSLHDSWPSGLRAFPSPFGYLQQSHTDRMGAYRALADLVLAAARKSDWETAARLSRVMEVYWDNNEPALKANANAVWTQVDRAMDRLINPILEYRFTSVDLPKLEAEHNNYLEAIRVVK